MKISMETKNPGKLEGARQAFEKYFENVEIQGIPVNSNVGNQPVNEEILKGTKNRVKNLKEYSKNNNIKADFFVQSEEGITNLLGEWIDINCVVVESKEGIQSVGTSQDFPIPDKYVDEIKKTDRRIIASLNHNQFKFADNGYAFYDYIENKILKSKEINKKFNQEVLNTQIINGKKDYIYLAEYFRELLLNRYKGKV